jgi:hypothetical protein
VATSASTKSVFAVGYGSLGTFSNGFTELVSVPPSTYQDHRGRATGDAVVRHAGDQSDQESRSAGHRAATSLTAMDSTTCASFLPHNDPDASLASYRDTVACQ